MNPKDPNKKNRQNVYEKDDSPYTKNRQPEDEKKIKKNIEEDDVGDRNDPAQSGE